MTSHHMTPADFEALYRREADPWGYTSSAYERAKYDATLAACGPGPFPRALELGASIGVLSARLAPRCGHLVTIDAAATAVAAARARLAGVPGAEAGVEVVQGAIPGDLPAGPWDLVLASEILYYLTPDALQATLGALRDGTRAGARIVAVHWRTPGPERPFTAAEVHRRLLDAPWAQAGESASTDDYLLDVVTRR